VRGLWEEFAGLADLGAAYHLAMGEGRLLGFRGLLVVLLLAASVGVALGMVILVGWIGVHILGSVLGGEGGATMRSFDLLAIGAGCIAAACATFCSLLPGFERHVPLGPVLTPASSPDLFRELGLVAEATGQALPDHVYLTGELNAFVVGRGGVLGFGSRCVMGIGVGLLALLTVSEFRAVLAHELGHLRRHDTRFAFWAYRARRVVCRTLENLDEVERAAPEGWWMPLVMGATRAPFVWLASWFLDITHAISREQEFAADAAAARIAGSVAMCGGLIKIAAASSLFDSFWNGGVLPAVKAGFRPPLIDGFREVLDSISPHEMSCLVDRVMREPECDDEGPHPSLSRRVAAATALYEPGVPKDDRLASVLVPDARLREAELAALLAGPATQLAPSTWDEATASLYTQSWRDAVVEWQPVLGSLTPATLPRDTKHLHRLMQARFQKHVEWPLRSEAVNWASHVFGTAIAVTLLDAGHKLSASPGRPVSFSDASSSSVPFEEVREYLEGVINEEAWLKRMRELRIADVQLGKPDSEAEAGSPRRNMVLIVSSVWPVTPYSR
jgi:heat shock protein HtpX